MSTSTEAREEEIRVDLCGPLDRAEQARLFNACFKKHVDAAALAWRYDRNPHGASVSLLSRPPGGEGVCGYACSPRLAWSFGDEGTLATLGETGDVMTHPEWRKRGLFSALDRACMAETKRLGWPVVFGLPNRRSAHIFLKQGWIQVGTISTWTLVLRADELAQELRAREGRLRGWFTGLGARRARRGLRALQNAGVAKNHEGWSVRELERFPDEVGALANEVAKGFCLMVRRDAAYLNWRFLDAPSRLFTVLGVFDASDAFHGYCVVQRPRADAAIGFLVDVLGRDDRIVATAIRAGIRRLEDEGASLVQASAVDGSWWRGWVERAGFLAPAPDHHLIVIAHLNRADHALARAARDASTWYLTDGDRDDETMG